MKILAFILAALAAVGIYFGFFDASPLSGAARVIGIVAGAFAVLMLAFGMIKHEHGHAIARTARWFTAGAALAALIAAGYTYANRTWSAETAGRAIDRNAYAMIDDTGDAMNNAGDYVQKRMFTRDADAPQREAPAQEQTAQN